MLKNLFTLLFFVMCSQFGFSQRKPPIKWGKVSEKDLQMTVYERDTTAEAVVLCNFGTISVHRLGDEWHHTFKHHKRIKILKKSGFHYGEIIVPFIHHENSEGISPIRALVISPSGEKTIINKEYIFTEKIDEFYSISKVALPNIQVGSIIEYQYKIISDRIVALREWQFQEEIPTRYSELQISFPQWFSYNYLFQGTEYMEKTEEGKVTIFEGDKGLIKLGEGWFSMENAVAFKEPEKYITTLDDYITRIRFQLSEVFYQDGRKESFITTWEKLCNELEHERYFGEQFLKKKNHKKILETVSPLITNAKNETETAQILYDFFNLNVEWNGRHELWMETNIDDAFEKKSANGFELNLMMLSALLHSEIKAYPLLVSTRGHGKMYEKYPLISQFNHLMVLAVLDGKETIIDLSQPFLPLGYPKMEALNGKGWIMNKSNPQWIKITPPSGMEVFSVNLSLNEEGTAVGVLHGAFKGFNGVAERNYYLKDTIGRYWQNRLEEKFPETQIEEISTENFLDKNETFKSKLELIIPEAAQVVGDFFYFSPVLHSAFDENIFKLEKRYYPVDIPYPFTEQYILNLKIPEGYNVEELPESVKFVLPGKGGSFSFVIEQKDDLTLQLVSRLQIKQLKYVPQEYPAIKELFDLVSEKYGEQIVLKKKT